MADQRSNEMLALNFVSRSFAHKTLAQGLGRALSAFSSCFMREYLDQVINADQCAQYVDDIGRTANTVTQLIRNFRAVFENIKKHWPEINNKKRPFWSDRIKILGKGDNSPRSGPQRP